MTTDIFGMANYTKNEKRNTGTCEQRNLRAT